LPSRPAVAIGLSFNPGFVPQLAQLQALALQYGYEIAGGTLQIQRNETQEEWRFVAISLNQKVGAPLPALSEALRQWSGVASYTLAHARN